jgi:transposase-like protein
MLGHGTKFGRKKDEAVAALLTHRNIEEAARAIGVVPNTLLRWMKEPEFDAAYRAAKRAAFGQAVARLQQGASAAATTLLKTMRQRRSGYEPLTACWATRRRPLRSRTSKSV